MSVLEIILTTILGLFALILIIYYLVKVIKNNYLSKVYDTILKAMKEAEEKFTDGKEKKEYVLSKVKELCKDLDIPYDFIATLISKVIENVIKGYNGMIK